MYDPRYTFYTIDKRYLEYLRIYDSRVPKKNSRPYIGLVSKRGNYSYFSPLSRDKKGNHPNNEFGFNFYKQEHGKSKKIGRCNVMNSIPVPEQYLKPIIFKYLDVDSRDTLQAEYKYLKRHNLLTKSGEMLNNLYNRQGTKVIIDFKKLEKAHDNFLYISNNLVLQSRLRSGSLELESSNPQIINNIYKPNGGKIVKVPALCLVDGNLSVNPDYNYAHLEESMYQTMIDDIKKGEGKANQLITPNKTKDNDYER